MAYPLTLGQLSVWRAVESLPIAMRWEGNIEAGWAIPAGFTTTQVRRAIDALTLRHESLRTVYRHDGADAPQQIVLELGEVWQGEMADPPGVLLRQPFDLAVEMPWRVWKTPHGVHLTIHHMAADGAALSTMEADFRSLLLGSSLQAAPKPRDLALLQRTGAYRGRLEAALRYRALTLAALPEPVQPITAGPVLRAVVHTGIPYGIAQKAARRLRVTLPNLILSAYARALASAAEPSVLLYQMAANRLDPQVRELVTSMNQWVPMLAAATDRPFASFAAEVNVNAFKAMQFGCYDPGAARRLDPDPGYYFTAILPPSNPDPGPAEIGPSSLEWLEPLRTHGPNFYLIAKTHPEVELTLRVTRAGYRRWQVEEFLSHLSGLLNHEARQ